MLDKCAVRFYQTRQEMGIGLYADSVYVGIRKRFHLMKESLEHLSSDVTADDIQDRYILARGTMYHFLIALVMFDLFSVSTYR